MSKQGGGPAFPSHGSMGEVTHEGMSVRDYATIEMMRAWRESERAELCYRLSPAYLVALAQADVDAFLAAREDVRAVLEGEQ